MIMIMNDNYGLSHLIILNMMSMKCIEHRNELEKTQRLSSKINQKQHQMMVNFKFFHLKITFFRLF